MRWKNLCYIFRICFRILLLLVLFEIILHSICAHPPWRARAGYPLRRKIVRTVPPAQYIICFEWSVYPFEILNCAGGTLRVRIKGELGLHKSDEELADFVIFVFTSGTISWWRQSKQCKSVRLSNQLETFL